MIARYWYRAFIISLLMLGLLLAARLTQPASAHDWYSGTRDPISNGLCCGGNDCAIFTIREGNLSATAEGYRVVLSLEETRHFNPRSVAPLDALIPWARVQASQDGNWHMCVKSEDRKPPGNGVFCFWAPPNT